MQKNCAAGAAQAACIFECVYFFLKIPPLQKQSKNTDAAVAAQAASIFMCMSGHK